MFELVLFDSGLGQAVTAMVRSGFYSSEDILDFFRGIAHDDPDAGLSPDTVDDDVRKAITAAVHVLSEDAETWPEKTDNDRLQEAFQHLNNAGIRAVENHGYEASDCGELYREIQGDPQWRGYCFYHKQDLVRAVLDGDLALRFSAAIDKPTDEDNRGIGRTIVDALHAYGLQPEWDGDPRKIILVRLKWQRRPHANGLRDPPKTTVAQPGTKTTPWWKFW